MSFRPHPKLRARLALLVATAMVPCLGLILHAGLRERRDAAGDVAEETLRLVHQAATRHKYLVEGSRNLLVALARTQEVATGDSAGCSRLLAETQAEFPGYTNLIVVRPDGELLSSARPIERPMSVAHRAWFQETLRTRGFATGSYLVGKASGRPMIAFGYPVFGAGGKVTRVVSAGLDLSWLGKLAEEMQLPRGWNLTVLDRRGTVLARYPESAKWIGKTLPSEPVRKAIAARPSGGTVEAVDSDGISRIHAFGHLVAPGTPDPVYVEFGIPTRAAYAQAARSLYWGLGLLVLVGVGTLAAGVVGSEILILRPVRAMASAAERLSEGDLTARVSSGAGGELGQLAAAFDRMAASLQIRIAERQQAVVEARASEAALVETNRTLESLIQASPVAIIAEDRDAKVRLWNPAAERIFGWTQEEVLGKPIPIIPPEESEQFRAQFEEELRGAVRTGVELKRLRKDGSTVDVRLSTAPYPDAEGNIVGSLALFDDMSGQRQAEEEQKRLQEHLRQQDRLAAVGEMAAGIAHDFNNILLAMTGYTELALLHPDVPSAAREKLNVVLNQGFRAAELIRQILDFTRRSLSEKQPLQVGSLTKELCKLLERTLPERIRISYEADEGEHWVEGDPTQIQQILMNLAVNARDAMPGGGTLVVRLERRQMDARTEPPFPTMDPGDWLVLSVADTGAGIAPEHLGRVFEPFFTTKSPGEGTGLGLAQVYGLVKQHNGFIGLESEVGQGTTFTIYLPPLKSPDRVEPKPAREDARPGSGETILVVEDEALVLEMVRAMLDKMGYRVLTARNGKEAMEVFDDQGDEIALVLTDWIMPEAGGADLAGDLQSRGAAVKVLVMSGYPLGGEDPEFLARAVDGFLQKPIRWSQLAEAVSRSLGRRS